MVSVPTITVDDRKFHADFATESPTLATFESSDGVRFKFSLHVLASVSTFFADLASLPAASAGSVIALPHATAPAFALALHLIRDQFNPRTSTSVSWPDATTLEGLINVVNAYDLGVARDILVMRCPHQDKGGAINRLVLEACTASPFTDVAMKATVMLNLDDEGVLTPWARATLDKYAAPDWHLRLIQFQVEWYRRFSQFLALAEHLDCAKHCTACGAGSHWTNGPCSHALFGDRIRDLQKLLGRAEQLDTETVSEALHEREYFNNFDVARLTKFFGS